MTGECPYLSTTYSVLLINKYLQIGIHVYTIFFFICLVQSSFSMYLSFTYLLYPATAYIKCTSSTQAADVMINSEVTKAPPHSQESYVLSDTVPLTKYTCSHKKILLLYYILLKTLFQMIRPGLSCSYGLTMIILQRKL